MISVEKKIDFKPVTNLNTTNSTNDDRSQSFKATRTKDSMKNKIKLPNEVERWALGQKNSKYEANYDSDEFDEIDDTYLKTIAQNDPAENEQDEKLADKDLQEQQRIRIREMITNLRKNKEIKKKLSKGFYGVLESAATINQKPKEQTPTIQIENKLPEDEEIVRIENGIIDLKKETTKSGKSKEKKFQFKSLNNGMTRAVPGSLQQNITVERTFFKDLLDLSKQRYLYKLSADFQKRQFAARQERKGLVKLDKKENKLEMPDILTRVKIVSNQSRVQNARKFKSSSAFGLRHENKSQEDQIEFKKIDKPKTSPNELSNFSKHVIKENESIDKLQLRNNKKIQDFLESSSQPDLDNRFIRNSRFSAKQSSPLKPALKRPSTSLAMLTTVNVDENDFQVDYFANNTQVNNKSRENPTADNRYKCLVDSMNKVYSSKKENISILSKIDLEPSERVRNLIRSNKALQGAGWNGDMDKENPTRFEIDLNRKLFEKSISIVMETIDKSGLNKLTDDQLFKALKDCGLTAGPITGTTRSIYEKRLKNFLENNSTLISDKTITNSKTITSGNVASIIENLTSSSCLSEQANTKSIQPLNKDLTSTKNNSIFSNELTDSPKNTAQNDFTNRPKNIVEQPLSRSQSLRESTIERQKREEATLITTRIPKTLTKINEYGLRENNVVEAPESRSINSLESQINRDFKHIENNSSLKTNISNQLSSRVTYNDYIVKQTEKQAQQFNEPSESSANVLNDFMGKEKPRENIRPNHASNQYNNQVSTTSTISISSKPCYKAPVIENISSKSYVNDLTSKYETASSVHLLASQQTLPQIIPNRFETHRASSILKDKYAERLHTYGLHESSSIRNNSKLETEETSSYFNINYTPGTIRARKGLHATKPSEEESITASTTSTKAETYEQPKKELINYKYLLAVLLATCIVYWVIVNYMQSNPENPVDF